MKVLLKVLSVLMDIAGVIQIIGAIVCILLSGFGMAGLMASGGVGIGALAVGVAGGVAGVVCLISGIFDLACGICGYKGANGDRKRLNIALVLGIIALVFSIINMITSANNLGLIISILFVISIVCVKAKN